MGILVKRDESLGEELWECIKQRMDLRGRIN